MRRIRRINTKSREDLNKNIHFITYGSGPYEKARTRLCNQAKFFFDFQSITSYGRSDLEQKFIESTKGVLDLPRGGGYWIWKPYIISKKLEEINEGDYLIFMDAGCVFNNDGFERFKQYIELLNQSETPIIGFQMSHQKEKWWTTDKIFNYFNLSENSPVGESGQILSGIQIMKKCEFTTNFFKKLNKIIEENPYLLTDEYNKETTRNDFRENRHDQSLLSILLKIEGCIIIEDETYFQKFGSKESRKFPIWATRMK